MKNGFVEIPFDSEIPNLGMLRAYACGIVENIKRLNEQGNDVYKSMCLGRIKNTIQIGGEDNTYEKYFKNVCEALLNLNAAFDKINQKDKQWIFDVNGAVEKVWEAYRCIELLDGRLFLEAFKQCNYQSQSWNADVVDRYLKELLKTYNELASKNGKDDAYNVPYILALTSSLFRALVPETSFYEREEYSINALTKIVNQEEGVAWELFASKSNDSNWGMILPDPQSIFITFNSEFFQGIKDTNNLLNDYLLDKVDVFWRLESTILGDAYDNNSKYFLEGNSMGACFHTLIRTILDDE